MKVLKDNYNAIADGDVKRSTYPRKIDCERCGSELEYEESDLRIGYLGCVFVDCPLCGNDTLIEGNEHEIELTMDNVEFPTHYYHFSTECGAVDCCDNYHVNEYIRQAIEYFRENKDEYIWWAGTGNLFIMVSRYSGDENYQVTVSGDYYQTELQFEREDYE